ncbi:hypothetical protein ACQ3G6_01375 [Allorhizobium undicola]|uniref:hypothetical protein n=1 Tax=Allorhizobium undicola TaxID=78527 RepID=UPI000AB1CE51|nr:hypothetical protein [Allorhizobium undicola]
MTEKEGQTARILRLPGLHERAPSRNALPVSRILAGVSAEIIAFPVKQPEQADLRRRG